jgi:hypothetical protein
VHEISDVELQRRKWLDLMNSNPHWSYVEFACSYPDDDQLRFAKENAFLTVEEFDLLTRLARALDAYEAPHGESWNNEAVLADPAWRSVVGGALRVKRQLLQLVDDSAERLHLLGKV